MPRLLANPIATLGHLQIAKWLVFILLIPVISGCSLQAIQQQGETIDTIGIIKGEITVASSQQGPLLVQRYVKNNDIYSLESQVFSDTSGHFIFYVLPMEHYLAAFIDINRDGQYNPGEHANYYGYPAPVPIRVEANKTVDIALTISGELPAQAEEITVEKKLTSVYGNIGRTLSLSDPIFSRDNYSMGMWRCLDFLDQVGGGLFFLEDYQEHKVPVLFVHGINGGPDDFSAMIDNLDQTRFQPWVVYYPSGIRLAMVSDYLLQAMSGLREKYGFTRFYVIAHSMGGLVSRSFIKKYVEKFPENNNDIVLAMTINSPMGGMPSAAMGVEISPIVVPSWRDVASGSEFLEEIHTWEWPKTIPYYLIFTFKSGEGGDGVAALESQLPLKLQSESLRIYGFNNDHAGTLRDEKFIALFNDILAASLTEID